MIRAAASDDAAVVAELATQLGYSTSAAQMGTRLAGLLDRPDHVVLVAERDDRVVAWIHGTVRLLVESDPYVEIGGFLVDEAHRGQGIGRGLLQALESWALGRGYRRLRVRSNVLREDARRFYQGRGFAVCKRQAVFDKSLEAPA